MSAQTLRADAAVIGSGAGGGPVAAALAEAGMRVVILEAGPRLGAADFSPDESEMTRRLGKTTATDDASLTLYAGACVGGSTVVNDALCWRPPPEVLEAWVDDHGLPELAPAKLAPYVDRVWGDVHASPTTRDYLARNAYRLELGAKRLGWAAEAMPRNVRGCARLGRCNFGCPTNAKQSTLVTYLPRAERAGARVLPLTRAERIEVGAGAVRAVEATRLDADTRQPIDALRVEAPVVCVAAGVLGSPALLLRSGIAAGADLQFHSTVHVAARFAEPIHGYFGPTMGMAVSEFSDVNGFRGPGFMIEHTAVHPVITASALPGFGADHARAMAALPYLARSVVLVRDRSRGRVRLEADGAVHIDYALEPQDLERLRAGMAATARAYLAADAREVYLPVNDYPSVRSERDLDALRDFPLDPSRLSLLYAVHLFGGAAMGASPERSVCSDSGAVWDVKGLFVTDASSLPTNTGVNPQITIMANALRIADGIAATAGSA